MFFYLKTEKNELNKKLDILNKIINDNILQKNLEDLVDLLQYLENQKMVI